MYRRGLFCLLILAVLPLSDLVAQSPPATSSDAQADYEVAVEHYRHQRWKLAAEEFEAFLVRHRSAELAASARFFAGEAALQDGQRDVALQHYLDYLEADHAQYHGLASFRAGECAYLLENESKAEQLLSQFLKSHPTHAMRPYAHTYLGNLALEKDDAAVAVEHFGAALRQFSDQRFADECRFGIAQAYQALGQTDDARRFYAFLIESPRFQESAKLQLAVLTMPTDAETAEHELRQLLREADDDQIATQAAYWLGMIAHQSEQWAEATELLRDLELETPELAASAAFTCAHAFQQLDDQANAGDQLRRIIKEWPQSHLVDDAYYELIKVVSESRDFSELDRLAAAFFSDQPASDLGPLVARVHGRALIAQNRLEDAERSFERTPARLRTANDWYHLAIVRLALKKNSEALLALDHVQTSESSPLYSAALLARATAMVRLNQFEQATPILEAYLAQEPNGVDSDRCRAQLTIALASLGHWEAALDAYSAIRKTSGPEYWSTTQYLAEGAAARDDRTAARRLYSRLAADAPEATMRAVGLAGLAWLNDTPTDQVDAADAMLDLLARHPDSELTAKTVLRRARALREQQKTVAAIDAYALYLDHFPNRTETATARLELAELLDRAGRDADARAQLELLLESEGAEPIEDRVRYLLGWVNHDLGHAETSLTHFRWLVDQAPESPLWADAAYRLAEGAAKAQRLDEADRLARRITAREQTETADAHAWYLRGQLAAKRLQWREVETAMRRVLALDVAADLYVPAKYWIAESLYRRREYEKAEIAFTALKRLTQGREDAWLGMLSLREAQILAHRQRWKEAFDLAQQLRQARPDFAQMHEVDYLLGRCQGSWADFDGARASYRRVTSSPRARTTETAAMAQWMIGETYLLQRNYEKAIREYHRVLRSPRWQAAALLQASKCHLALKQPAQALRLLEQLLNEFPQSEHAKDAKARRQALLAEIKKQPTR